VVIGVILVLAIFLVIWTFGWPSTVGQAPIQTWTIGKPIGPIALSPDRQLLAVGLQSGGIELRQMTDGKLINTFTGRLTNPKAVSLAFSPDGRLLASSMSTARNSDPNIIQLWRVDDGTLVTTMPQLHTWIWSLAFSSDGQLLAA